MPKNSTGSKSKKQLRDTTGDASSPAHPAKLALAMHRVALAQHRAALAGQQAALAGLHAELIGLHAMGVAGGHAGTIKERVFAVLKQCGAEGQITTAATLEQLNLVGDTVCGALNNEFFHGQNIGLSEDQCTDDTMVGTLILEIHDLLGN